MSLLPIIYTSLLIFSGTFLVILIISYVSYKIKHNNKVSLAAGNRQTVTASQIQSLSIINSSEIKEKSIRQVPPTPRHPEKSQSLNNNNYYPRNERRIEKKRVEIIAKVEPKKAVTQRKNPIARMSIIENISEPQTVLFANAGSVSTQSRTNSFSEQNILRYYEDF